MSQSVADSVRGRCSVIAVSDSYRLAPWADVLVSSDVGWWRFHPEAKEFKGRKFTLAPDYAGLEGIERVPGLVTGINSGLFGVKVAAHLGAKRILLFGVDLHSPGSHFFGRHPDTLRSSSRDHLERFKRQFAQYRPKGIEIINCTVGSALKCYPVKDLEDCLSEPAV